jgi:dTDP-4-amino-4,6-dideoxygalactose transaminase
MMQLLTEPQSDRQDERTSRLFLSPPHMSGKELDFVRQAFDSNYIALLGPMVEAFERELADELNVSHVLSTASGTAAIHLALRCLDIQPGDEIWASTLTFIGSVAPIVYERARPVFIDADPNTWTLDPDLLSEALATAARRNELPKAILPTDVYGQSCDLDTIVETSGKYGIPVICDSAEAMGTVYRGRKAGSGALMATYSFNGNKVITTSGGGALTSADEKLIQRARYLSTQAREPVVHYEHREVATNTGRLATTIGCQIFLPLSVEPNYEFLPTGLPADDKSFNTTSMDCATCLASASCQKLRTVVTAAGSA